MDAIAGCTCLSGAKAVLNPCMLVRVAVVLPSAEAVLNPGMLVRGALASPVVRQWRIHRRKRGLHLSESMFFILWAGLAAVSFVLSGAGRLAVGVYHCTGVGRASMAFVLADDPGCGLINTKSLSTNRERRLYMHIHNV